MNDQIKAFIAKAMSSLEAAKKLNLDGYYDFAASRAYYSIFYISEALLLTKDKTFKKHTAVIGAIYEYFVKQGTLPSEFHRILKRSYERRNDSDYLLQTKISKDIAESLLSDVEKQVKVGIEKLESIEI